MCVHMCVCVCVGIHLQAFLWEGTLLSSHAVSFGFVSDSVCVLFLKAPCTSNLTNGLAAACVFVCAFARVLNACSHIVTDGFSVVRSRGVVPFKQDL